MTDRKTDLKLGPVSRAWLAEIGIRTRDDLERRGSVEAYVELKRRYPMQVSLNLLYGLEAVLTDIHWTKISKASKQRLRAEADAALKR
ncbi:MAG: TfoX/Sxy family DNA transformation protein [Bacteroidetes bacterium]|nr:TfoX/Sxy family DNA transformation protein [Bacteroidota bacterium]